MRGTRGFGSSNRGRAGAKRGGHARPTSTARTQPERPAWNPGGYRNNSVHRIEL